MSLASSKSTKSKKNNQLDIDTKLSLLMKSLTDFYKNPIYIEQMKNIVDQNSVISLRILDWFITNYSKKYRTIIKNKDSTLDVYQNYKLQLKSFSKKQFDPFCRKNKILFYYNDDNYIETSCGQLCFFRWCFENSILNYVQENLNLIEQDMKTSLKSKKNKTSSSDDSSQKRQPLSVSASRTVSKQNISYIVKFDKTTNATDVANTLKDAFGSAPEVKTYGSDSQLKITTVYRIDEEGQEVDEEVQNALFTGLKSYIGDTTYENFKPGFEKAENSNGIMSYRKVDPTIADDIKTSALFSSTSVVQHIIPDFNISIIDGQLDLEMNTGMIPELRINSGFKDLLQGYKETKGKQSKTQKETVFFVKQKLDSAKWFIDAIKQRQQTLFLTMNAIMNYQYDYFLTGDETNLKPMILKDIAEKVNLDISTISRVANSKYVETEFGMFALKFFFSEGVSTSDGEEVSNREIKKILSTAIVDENKRKPHTDEALMVLLRRSINR